MLEIRSCAHCGKEFSPSDRADKKFCNESCSKKYAVRKKLQEQESQKLKEQQLKEQQLKEQQNKLSVQKKNLEPSQEPQFYEAEVVHQKNANEQMHKIPNLTESANWTAFEIRQGIENLKTKLAELSSQKDNLMIDYVLRKEQLEKAQKQSPPSIFEFVKTLQLFKDDLVKHSKTQIHNRSYAKIEEDLAIFFTKKTQIKAIYENMVNIFKIDQENDCKRRKLLVLEKANQVNQVISQKNQCRSEIQTAQNNLQKLQTIVLETIRLKEKPRQQASALASTQVAIQAQKPEQISATYSVLKPINTKNVVFERLNLRGDGLVLGDFYKGKAFIFLKGKAGAGKTTFSFALLKSLISANLKCAYFILETGYTPQIKASIDRNGLYNKFELYDSGDVNDLKQVCKSGIEAVFIDSWQKLNANSKEIEVLRNEYPNVIFVSISQETNEGSMRGGQALYYDATCILDVQNRGEANKRSICVEKSRYSNQGKQYTYAH